MKIVIDIPEEMHERIKDGYVPLGISKYLKNGTPLPNGHGDLIDRKALMDNGYQMESVEMWYGIKYAPTIIEADRLKEGEAE